MDQCWTKQKNGQNQTKLKLWTKLDKIEIMDKKLDTIEHVDQIESMNKLDKINKSKKSKML